MSEIDGEVVCPVHGPSQATFVCRHIVEGLREKRRVGFFWPSDSLEASRPDAWCSECDDRVQRTGGEWVGEAEEHLGAQLLCGHCYDQAKRLNLGG